MSDIFDDRELIDNIALDIHQRNRNGAPGIYLASRYGHTAVVRHLLDLGVDADTRGGQYGTAIQAAAFAGHKDIVQLLLKRGASPSDVRMESEFSSALHAALATNHNKTVELLLECGSPFTCQKQFDDALETAVHNGNIHAVQKLLQSTWGSLAPPNSLPDALQGALFKGNTLIVSEILGTYDNINAQRGFFGNALAAAIAGCTPGLVKIVADAGASLESRGRFGYPIRAAVVAGKSKYRSEIAKGRTRKDKEEIVLYLLEQGCDPNAFDHDLGDPLQAASCDGDVDMMLLLLQKGADIFGAGGFFENTLQAAAFNGHEQAVRLILERCPSVESFLKKRGRYRDALQAAVFGGQEHIVALLLQKGARVNPGGICRLESCSLRHMRARAALPNRQEQKQLDLPLRLGPLEIAARQGNTALIAILLDNGAIIDHEADPWLFRKSHSYDVTEGDYTALQIASYWGHIDTIIYLLDRGADINNNGYTLGTALQASLECRRLDVAKVLLARGARIDEHWLIFGSCLQVACERGFLDVVQFLVDHGANIEDVGGENGTALQVACYAGHLEVVQFMLDKGAHVNAPGRSAGNALQAAAASGHLHIARLLLEHGAIVENNFAGPGLSSLQLAAGNGHESVVRLLLDHGAQVAGQSVCDSEDCPALHLATWHGHFKVVTLLLQHNANVHARAMFPSVRSGTSQGIAFNGTIGDALLGACRRGMEILPRSCSNMIQEVICLTWRLALKLAGPFNIITLPRVCFKTWWILVWRRSLLTSLT